MLNFVDAGTSTWLLAEAHADFQAESVLEAVVHFLTRYGRPRRMTFDRDTLRVGSHGLRHIPSAFCRFAARAWACNPLSARRVVRTKMRMSRDFTARLVRSAHPC